MKTVKILICVVLSALAFSACSDTETYADQKKIVRKGCGEKIEEGESTTVLCRFNEYNLIESDTTLQLTNIYQYAWLVDKMNVRNTSGTFTASFDTRSSLMYTRYGTAAVPSGWLVPLRYVAKVNLIVPHSEGQYDAARYVYPCRYEITFERGR